MLGKVVQYGWTTFEIFVWKRHTALKTVHAIKYKIFRFL